MPRKPKKRLISFQPQSTYFKPRGVPLSSLKEVSLTLDEIESLRLVDYQGLDQAGAAAKMTVSQSTLQRILRKARGKTAEALTSGKAIELKGGEVEMIGFGRGRGRGGQVGSAGRGRMGGPAAAGPGGVCLCTNPECRAQAPHQAGVPCYQMKCPKCGSPMIRQS